MKSSPQPHQDATERGAGGIDRLGAMASSVCAVHCAAVALLPASLGALGLGVLMTDEVEWALVALAIVFAAGALVLGWRQHRSVVVAVTLAAGIVALLASRGLEMGAPHGEGPEHGAEHGADHARHETVGPGETWHTVGTLVGVAGGVLLLVGHAFNHRESRRCRLACDEAAQATQHPS